MKKILLSCLYILFCSISYSQIQQNNNLTSDDIQELSKYYKSGDYQKLEDKTFELLRNKTQTEELDFFLGLSYMHKYNYVQASKYFVSALQNERVGYKPSIPLLGECLVHLEKYEEAIVILDQAIQLGYGDYSFFYRGRAKLRKNNADLDGAISDFEYFLNLSKDEDSISTDYLSSVYYYLGNAYLEKAVIEKEKNFMHAENIFQNSIENYLNSLKYDSNSYIVNRDLGVAYMLFNQEEKAIPFFEKSLQINENQPNILQTLNVVRGKVSYNRIKLKKEHDIYFVPVKLNNVLDIDFVFDSGASDVSITPEIALTLVKTGTITENDWLPGAYYKFADGTTAKSMRFNLKSVKIGNKIISNVTCSISNSLDAPMLLGQSVLSKFGKYTFDYKNNELIFD
ncbi:MAG: retroviral-like aspartic protease family protein [Weeksellaceae bacterium]